MSTWTLTYDARPWSLNDERQKHWSWRAGRTKEWKEAFHLLALEQRVPPCEEIEVTVGVQMPGRVQDICNAYPAAKAAIDGLVDAGVIPDDTPEHLSAVTFTAPRREKQAAVTLTVRKVR